MAKNNFFIFGNRYLALYFRGTKKKRKYFLSPPAGYLQTISFLFWENLVVDALTGEEPFSVIVSKIGWKTVFLAKGRHMMGELFGTDGIRGEVGKYPLTRKAVFGIGRSLGLWLKEKYPREKSRLRILIGKDTRESGEGLELALLKGAKSEGLEVRRIGVCPTPAVAYLTRRLHAHLGAAISASHNPCTDNGIKIFNADGYKFFAKAENRIEEIFSNLAPEEADIDLGSEDFKEDEDYISLYKDFARSSLNGLSLSGLKIVLDCAFGSFSKIAPEVFRESGAQVFAINDTPDGKNINVNCGTLYPQAMAEKILKHGADLGVAFDGDGDRVIIADSKGKILDGDHILAILAQYFLQQKKLAGKSVICTQMSNIGLELYLQRLGIQTIRTKVGDKYVLQEMLRQQVNLGGEQSGHIIILERTTTGDGLIVSLELIKAMLKRKKCLTDLYGNLKKFPQILVNVKVKEKLPLEQIPGLEQAIADARKELGRQGRLLVRYSGTENLARIMIEGKESSLINRIAGSLSRVIKDAVGEG